MCGANSLQRPPKKQLGGLRKRRTLLGLTQQDVAACLTSFGISRDGLARIELGEIWPNPVQIVALAHFYEAEVGALAAELIADWLRRRNRSNLLLLKDRGSVQQQPSLPLVERSAQ